LFLLFCRLMPVINMSETKATLAKQYHMAHHDEH
jgi:molybdopterin-containing oxidoreductase family membrane subunit